MANISFANLNQNFSMSSVGVTAFVGADSMASGFEYSFLSASGDIEFNGAGITVSAGIPTGGTVDGAQIDLDNDNQGAPEIIITGFSNLFTGAVSFDLMDFGIGVGSATNQNITFWKAALSANDAFDFTMADYSVDLEVYGDGVFGTFGLPDTFAAGASPLTGNSVIVGDFRSVVGGSTQANPDYFTVGAWMVIGDYYDVSAGFTFGETANDVIAPVALADNKPGVFYFIGDAAYVTGGVLGGGEDLIDLSATDVSAVSTSDIVLVGDTLNISGGTAYGGSDTIYGSAAGELIYGDDANNSAGMVGASDSLRGNGGDDTIFGGGGHDKINGGAGADYIDGQAGLNLVEYIDAGAGVLIDLNAETGTFDIAQGDTLIAISDIYGSNFNDTLIGDNDPGGNLLAGFDGDDSINGLADNDTLQGGLGTDTLDGGDGDDSLFGDNFIDNDVTNDVLFGGEGDDYLDGGKGADFLDGGLGNDILGYNNADAGIFIDLGNNIASGDEAFGDMIAGFEGVNAGSWDDTLIGDGVGNYFLAGEGDDSVDGAGGDDFIFGFTGADTLVGGAGADTLNGGGHIDIASYENSAASVIVDLLVGVGSSGDAAGDTLTEIEDLWGSAYADSLLGGLDANTLYGRDGADTLIGNAGADTLVGGAGADAIDGGAQIDVASYETSAAPVIVDLLTGAGSGGDAAGDTFTGIEILWGSAFSDSLLGGADGNKLFGRDGADTLIGYAGDDTLVGESGNDRVFAGLGHDRVDGGLGDDFARTSNGNDALSGGDGNDTLGSGSGRDFMRGGAGADLLLGSNGTDTLYGDSGNDTVLGGGGRDLITGGDGDDRLVGGAQNDRFHFAPGSGADVIVDFEAGVGASDVIGLFGFGASLDSFAEAIAASTQVGNNVVIDLGGGDVLTLQGVTIAGLDADDFVFG